MCDENKEKVQRLCKILQRFTLLLGIITIILPIVFWNRIPEVIPSHYNAAGIADQYSDKGILIFLLFMVALLMGIMSIAVYYVKQEMTSKYVKEANASQMSAAYIMLVFMNFTIQCIFAYITYCSATNNKLGSFFLLFALILVFIPIVVLVIYGYQNGKKNVSDESLLIQAENREEGITYRTKIDWWLGILLGGTMVLMLYIVIEPLIHGEGIQLGMTIVSVITLLIVLPLFFIKYTFYSTHLLISCGIYGKERVEYQLIRQMKETKNPISSAAMSLDRLQIDYMEKGYHQTVLISPVRKKEFIERLEQYRKNEKE